MIKIDRLNLDDNVAIRLVAERMRLTLMEVVGEERGSAMYELDWLVDRVCEHLDPNRLTGAGFVAKLEDVIVGHTLVRRDVDGDAIFGLFATFYVVPERRGSGVFDALVEAGEAWMRTLELSAARTYTALDNVKLHRAMARHGYARLFDSGEMTALGKSFA